MMGEKINYTIIIPHKNIPDLLQRCLDSIPKREDIQIVVVDDNSDTNIVDFKKFPGLREKNIKVCFTKKGGGAGYARNEGLKHVKGRWVLFADADDYFTDSFVDIIDKYTYSAYDLIYFGINGIDTDTQKINQRGLKYNKLMQEAVLNNDIDSYKYKAYVPWGKMIRHSLIVDNNILFDETFVANDMMFSIQVAYFSKFSYFDDSKMYTLESRSNSLVTKRTSEALMDRLDVYIRLNIFLDEIKKEKYRINLIPILYKMFQIGGYSLFMKGIRLINQKDKIGVIKDFVLIILSIPNRLISKIN